MNGDYYSQYKYSYSIFLYIYIYIYILLYYYIWLLVFRHPSEKYEFVSWDYEIPNIWKVIRFHGSKPPTRSPLIPINHH